MHVLLANQHDSQHINGFAAFKISVITSVKQVGPQDKKIEISKIRTHFG